MFGRKPVVWVAWHELVRGIEPPSKGLRSLAISELCHTSLPYFRARDFVPLLFYLCSLVGGGACCRQRPLLFGPFVLEKINT